MILVLFFSTFYLIVNLDLMNLLLDYYDYCDDDLVVVVVSNFDLLVLQMKVICTGSFRYPVVPSMRTESLFPVKAPVLPIFISTLSKTSSLSL